MYRKVNFRILAVFVLICSTFACNLGDTQITSDAEQPELRLAAWNIRIMSNKSRTDTELKAIARTLADYDFIAIVELRDEAVLKRTQKILSQMGKTYQYQLSPRGRARFQRTICFSLQIQPRQCC